ncbi:hypothetical protein [Cryptosporangium sp. NPDC051539]|uniref:hypothetical protein n=1 Tax=Cryptosporangium sp. NPDC051539 TaxID=3363962 RepID=UPI00379262F0
MLDDDLAAPLLVFGEVEWEIAVWTDDGRGIRTAEGITIGDVSGPAVVPRAGLLVLPSWHEDLRPAPDPLVTLVRGVVARPPPA